MMSHSAPRFFTRKEAADVLRVSTTKIDAAIHSGVLKAKREGRQYLIKATDLDEYFDSLPAA